jgi:hypothetical protein
MVQHLAARRLSARHLDVSARLNLAVAYYARLRSDIGWLKMYFRPNNPFPARLFGGYAKLINDQATSDIRTYSYLTADSGLDNHPALPSNIQVRPAADGDLAAVAEWFSSRGRIPELMANDLAAPETRLQSVGRRFAALKLERRREVIFAERGARPTGFALLEISSMGMNFSELTNAFTVHAIEDDPESRMALLARARERYAEIGRQKCIALAEDGDVDGFEAAGFVSSKKYTCWTFHRNHIPGMEEYFVQLFGNRRREPPRCT